MNRKELFEEKKMNRKELFEEPLTEGELDLLLYKFKSYLGSVSRAIINRQLKNKEYGDE